MKCLICNREIVLVPSAKERAAKFGGKPSDYIKNFQTHADCFLEQRKIGDIALQKKLTTNI